MAGTFDEQRLVADGFAHVLAELDWYDGPLGGLVDLAGVPHYFRCPDVCAAPEEYFVWPVPGPVIGLERERWAIFVEWNLRYEAGTVGPESHPGNEGVDARYEELTVLLTPHRRPPPGAGLLTAEWRFDPGDRYRADGVDYWVRWRTRE